ncbi:ComEA family DNA-binding protein, partial [Patescibacteria group bacterium]|nr:ComEA family DNA-binding protein [Patescibacteria group bacterium]
MRTLGLLALATLLPAFVYAAAALVNINTADATLLDTLPGIGPSKAAAIVEYRDVHGPFASIEDIQNVSGIGPSTYAGIAPFITVGDTAAGTSDNGSATASSTQSTQVSSTGAAAYTPPPSVLVIEAGTDRSAVLEVPLRLSALVKTKGGAADPSAHIA